MIALPWVIGLLIALPFGGWAVKRIHCYFRGIIERERTANRLQKRDDDVDPDTWHSLPWLPETQGYVERFFFCLLVGLYPTAITIAGPYLILKIASGWQLFGKPSQYYRCYTHRAIICGTVSIFFGIVGGLICAGIVPIGLAATQQASQAPNGSTQLQADTAPATQASLGLTPEGWGTLTVGIVLLVVGWLLGLVTDPVSSFVVARIWGPKLSIDFRENDSCLFETIEIRELPTGLQPSPIFYARLVVSNTKRRLATQCRAYLIKVERETDTAGTFMDLPFHDSLPLVWSYRNDNELTHGIDIPFGTEQFLDVVAAVGHRSGLLMQTSPQPTRYEEIMAEPGNYRLSVQVCAEQIKPKTVQLIVSRIGKLPLRIKASL